MQNVLRLACACALATLVGCAGENMNEWGQGSARDVITRGGVPDPALITIEGLLASHELPGDRAQCKALMCPRPALAVAPNLATGQIEYWVRIAMSSSIAQNNFVRPPLDMVVVIDKSATMAVDMAETNAAVVKLIEQLRPDDRLGVVAFDDRVHQLRSLGPVANDDQVKQTVRSLRAGGGWNLEKATAAAYEMLVEGRKPNRMRRVVTLSCANPIIDDEGRDKFSQLVLQHARDGIGHSFFAVLLGYDSRVAELFELSAGGAYRNVAELDQVAGIFDSNVDAMFTPVAYDMSVAFNGAEGFDVVDQYQRGALTDTATTFLGSPGTTLVARLAPAHTAPMPRDVGRITLSYVPEPTLGWTDAVSEQVDVRAPDSMGTGPYYETTAVRVTVALVNQAQQMKSACAAFHAGDRVGARSVLAELREYLSSEAAATEHAGLVAELELVDQLIKNMK